MKPQRTIVSLFLAAALPVTLWARDSANPAIDYRGFVQKAVSLEATRAARLVSEREFLKMASQPGTVILDARSKDKYENIHIRGAINLPLTDFTDVSLRTVIPDKATRILIYCNNNFENEPENFARKSISVALNIQTFINLHAYGYENSYELAPLLDIRTTRIPFAGKSVEK